MKKLLATALVLLCLTSCSFRPVEPVQSQSELIPRGATEYVELGGGWATFKLEGHKYLYRSVKSTTYAGLPVFTETVTAMPDDK